MKLTKLTLALICLLGILTISFCSSETSPDDSSIKTSETQLISGEEIIVDLPASMTKKTSGSYNLVTRARANVPSKEAIGTYFDSFARDYFKFVSDVITIIKNSVTELSTAIGNFKGEIKGTADNKSIKFHVIVDDKGYHRGQIFTLEGKKIIDLEYTKTENEIQGTLYFDLNQIDKLDAQLTIDFKSDKENKSKSMTISAINNDAKVNEPAKMKLDIVQNDDVVSVYGQLYASINTGISSTDAIEEWNLASTAAGNLSSGKSVINVALIPSDVNTTENLLQDYSISKSLLHEMFDKLRNNETLEGGTTGHEVLGLLDQYTSYTITAESSDEDIFGAVVEISKMIPDNKDIQSIIFIESLENPGYFTGLTFQGAGEVPEGDEAFQSLKDEADKLSIKNTPQEIKNLVISAPAPTEADF